LLKGKEVKGLNVFEGFIKKQMSYLIRTVVANLKSKVLPVLFQV